MRKLWLLSGITGLLLYSCVPSALTTSSAPETPAMPTPTETIISPTAKATAAYAWPEAQEMNRRIGRGINFGNALEAPQEGEWGIVLDEEYFQLVKDAGFDTIRLPIRWSTHTHDSDPYPIDSSFFSRVDWAVENALSRGLNIILDFHHFTEYMDCASCERGRFFDLWAQIAEHYRNSPPELMFELLNEPTNAVPKAEWNGALAAALGIIRITNPKRIVIVGPVGWNALGELSSLKLPEDDRNLIATYHYYEPFPFTHQGAEWMEGSEPWLGTTWTGTAAQERAIRNDFSAAAEWGRSSDRPIFLGEFGAYQKAEMESRARYTAAVAREAEALGFSWAYWEFCAGFGVYDPLRSDWHDPLLRALLPDSPLLDG